MRNVWRNFIENTRRKRPEQWIRYGIYLILFGLCLPYIGAIRYAVFTVDDFSFCITGESTGLEFLSQVISKTEEIYRTWQGTYVSIFFVYLLNPLHIGGYRLLRIILIAMFFLFIFAVFFLADSAIRWAKINPEYRIYLVAVFLIPLLSYRDYYEIYLWYTTSFVYLLPTIAAFIGLGLILRGQTKRAIRYYIAAIPFCFVMSGGILEIVGLGNFLILGAVIIYSIRNKKIDIAGSIVFILTFIVALTNAAAPGNFARHSIIDNTGINILETLFHSFKIAFQEVKWFCGETSLLFFVLLAFVIGYRLNRKLRTSIVVITLLCAVAIPAVTAFPVAMGYSTDSIGGFANRGLFLMDLAIIASFMGSAVLVGSLARANNLLPDTKTVMWGIVLASFIVVLIPGKGMVYSTPVQITENLLNGSIENYNSIWRRIYEGVANNEDSDVTISISKPVYVTGCLQICLKEEPDNWENQCVAYFYGKNSVTINWE